MHLGDSRANMCKCPIERLQRGELSDFKYTVTSIPQTFTCGSCVRMYRAVLASPLTCEQNAPLCCRQKLLRKYFVSGSYPALLEIIFISNTLLPTLFRRYKNNKKQNKNKNKKKQN